MNIDRRHLMLGTAAISLVALSGCSSEARADMPEASGTVDMQKLIATQPLPDVVEGDPNAPVTIYEYASMTCGACANFHNNIYPTIKEKYVETGKVNFVVREFPFDPRAAAAFMLARCAPGGKRAEMIDALFESQAQWARAENGRNALFQFAQLAGMDQNAFETCLSNQEELEKVMATFKAGEELGVDATPTFFIDGKRYSGVLSVEQMSAVLDSLLEA